MDEVRSLRLPDGRSAALEVVVNPRARRISLRIDPSRRAVVLIAPSPRQVGPAVAFAESRAGWVAAQLARLPQPAPFAPDARVPIRGVAHRLVMADGRASPRLTTGLEPDLIVPVLDPALFAPRVRRFLATAARSDLVARVEAHARTLGVRPTRISVKDTRSRWGSCTAAGALSFSWRVILAPPPILDYLAAHEVSHLLEMNHSPRFWAHVRACAPHTPAARTWLRRHGAQLHAYGAE